MIDYSFRNATLEDSSFIADVIIAAEKGTSGKLGFSTLFNLSHEKVKQLIISMLEEEVDGCEFSIGNYLIAENDGLPVASFGAWIEGFNESPPSKILKSNLIGFTFPPESINFLKGKSYLLDDFILVREKLSLQFEYAYVAREHRGKKLLVPIMEKLTENAVRLFPDLNKIQVQCYKNNVPMIRMLTSQGYSIGLEVESDNPEIFDYLPFNIKVIMEKFLAK